MEIIKNTSLKRLKYYLFFNKSAVWYGKNLPYNSATTPFAFIPTELMCSGTAGNVPGRAPADIVPPPLYSGGGLWYCLHLPLPFLSLSAKTEANTI
jgi:hypothetical protein